MNELRYKLSMLPARPGVYLFKNKNGEIIYIGKAKNLRIRVRSYFHHAQAENREQSIGPTPATQISNGIKNQIMLEQAADIDFITVSNETESLVLENNLIKKYKPQFNIRLRDDKNYQFIKIDFLSEIPSVYPIRQIDKQTGALSPRKFGPGDKKRTLATGKLAASSPKYFGPYTSGTAVVQTLKLLNRVFHICRNKTVSTRPCFAYHLGRCPGVCIGKISINKYKERFRDIELFLRHRQQKALKQLNIEMKTAARNQKYENAVILRDRFLALSAIWQKQKIVSAKNENQDYLGLVQTAADAAICALMVRGGRLTHKENFYLKHYQASPSEIFERFILAYYETASDIPKEILISAKPGNQIKLEKALFRLRGAKIKIICPSRGKKAQLLDMAYENAKLFHEQELNRAEKPIQKILAELAKILNLPNSPGRIEAYDISTIQGAHSVGSMVVFEEGRPAKNQYRKFKIKNQNTCSDAPSKPDDVKMIKEIIDRRLSRAKTSFTPSKISENKKNKYWTPPDLIVVDGGRGQLKAALGEIAKHNLQIPIIGLAKKFEEIYLPQNRKPMRLPRRSPVLQLLQNIRDEAHRFAHDYHLKSRSQELVESSLDKIPGIGPKTKKLLMTKFGSLVSIRNAPLLNLQKVVGLKKAIIIKEKL